MRKTTKNELTLMILNEYFRETYPDEYFDALQEKEDCNLHGYPVVYVDREISEKLRLEELEYRIDSLVDEAYDNIRCVLDYYTAISR